MSIVLLVLMKLHHSHKNLMVSVTYYNSISSVVVHLNLILEKEFLYIWFMDKEVLFLLFCLLLEVVAVQSVSVIFCNGKSCEIIVECIGNDLTVCSNPTTYI